MADPIQTKTASAVGTGHAVSASFTTLPAAGNTVLAVAWGFNGAATPNPACGDNQAGNIYVRRQFHLGNATTPKEWVAVFDLLSVVGHSGTFTVTVDDGTTGTAGYVYLAILEVSARTQDVGSSASSVGTSTAPAPGSVTPTTTTDFNVALFTNDQSSNGAPFTPGGWTALLTEPNGANQVGQSAYQMLASAGAVNPTWGTGSNNYAAAQEAYKAAAADVLMGQACL